MELGWFWAELNCQGKPSPNCQESKESIVNRCRLNDSLTPVGGPSQYLAGGEGHCQGAAGHGKGCDLEQKSEAKVMFYL